MGDAGTCPASTPMLCTEEKFIKSCLNNGICCQNLGNGNEIFCKCLEQFKGKYCETYVLSFLSESKEQMQKMQSIAAFSGVIGVFVIALFVVVIVLQVKYYRNRKKRSLDEHEMDVVSKPKISREDNDYKKVLIMQPGYSWRESVRTKTKKLTRSVPDLLQIGMTMALFRLTPKASQSTGDPGHHPSDRSECRETITDSTDWATNSSSKAHLISGRDGSTTKVQIQVEDEDTVD